MARLIGGRAARRLVATIHVSAVLWSGAPILAQQPVPPRTTQDSLRADSAALAARVPDSRLGAPLIAPGITYAPETRLAVGLGVLAITEERRAGQRPDAYGANLLVTQNGQFVLAGSVDAWTRDNRLRVESDLSFVRFPNRYFGLGLATTSTGEKYTPTSVRGSVTVQRAVKRGWYLGARVGGDYTTLSNLDTSGTIQFRPERDGWHLVTIGLQGTRDTRDRVYGPRHGSVFTLAATQSPRAIGSDFGFVRYLVDVREYVPLSRYATVAVQARGEHIAGTAPFERLPMLGGADLLRGYFAGRFRGESLALAQGELRLGPFRDLVGVTLFGAAGAVGPNVTALRNATYRRAGGGGLRLILNPQTGLAFRIDYGVGENGSRGWYITVGEAF